MIRMFAVVFVILAPAAPYRGGDIRTQIRQMEGELAKEPIQKGALLPVGSSLCAIYSPENIKKTEKLLKLHVEVRTPDVLAWREHLAWMYENCGKGRGDPWILSGRPVPSESVLPQTRGLERAYGLYKEALISERARELTVKIAKAYEDRYLQTGDQTLLVQARRWREEGGEGLDSVRSRHQALQEEYERRQLRFVPRPKIGRTGTGDFLRAVFISCVFHYFCVLFFMKLGPWSGISYHYYLIP